jgi:hypothetical protein
MVYIRQGVLVLAVAFIPLLLCATSNGPIFFPDDPILKMPPPVAVGKPYVHKINQPFDFVKNSVRYRARPPVEAGAINTLGNPPDSAWFTNRHASHRMSREELQRGPAQGEPPTAPFIVVGGKAEGISPGFRMEDAKHRTYFVKVDPPDNPEMATAADVIVSRFLFALGYNVPENDIVIAKLGDFKVSGKAELTAGRRKRKMTNDDFRDIVRRIPHYRDGSFRLMASRKIDGEALGPFYYEDIRADDPNDTVLHENRRDLRGLFVLFSWLNNTDARAGNTYDVVLEQNGVRFIKHYLLDFGSALGSDGDSPKDPRLGHEFMIATPHEAMRSILTLGLVPNKWERTHYGHLPAVGKFSAEAFEPADWKSDYPNQAFLSRLPDDDYWAAKQVMAFTDDDIRTIVETGQFTDAHVVDYLTTTLATRRDKIGKAFLSKVQPLDNFRVENDEIRFDDLAAQYNFRAPQNYEIYWTEFDNMTGHRTRIPGEPSSHLPAMAKDAAVGSYFLAVISSPNDTLQPVMVAVVKTAEGYRVVGSSRYEVRPSKL